MRVCFQKGKQKAFINKIISKISVEEAAKLCRLSGRTIRDWRREKFLMHFKSLKKLCRKANLKIPKNIRLKDNYWYVSKGASVGGRTVWKKYHRIGGDPEYLKKKWREWWKRDGCHRKNWLTVAKPIWKPPYSKELAEFIGIVLGDGCISQRQIAISLHYKDDKAYSKYVVSLIKKLFSVPIGVYYCKKDSVIDFVVSRTELVRYCTGKLGLKKGSKVKQQVDIPEWVKRNKEYLIACVRGLVDTDGCIFQHKYKVNGKWYFYKKLAFSNRSKPLLKSVFDFLKMLNMNPRITRDGKDVRLESKQGLRLYFSIINSHNPKYLKKYQD